MIALVDYHKGNLRSVEKSLASTGAKVCITDDPVRIAQAEAIVLPGVGAFSDAVATMQELGQMEIIRERILQGVPFLGICLGMHLMFEEGTEGSSSEEGKPNNMRGLAVLPGKVERMPREDVRGKAYKIPHVGWNSLKLSDKSTQQELPLLKGIESGEYFYFTHSYIVPDGPHVLATTTHSTVFPSVVSYKQTAYGVQFHPEKSSDAGAVLLGNFVNIVKGC